MTTINAHAGSVIYVFNGGEEPDIVHDIEIEENTEGDESITSETNGKVSCLDSYMWEEIDAICRQGVSWVLFDIGSHKKVKLKNGMTIAVQITGFEHDPDKKTSPIHTIWELLNVLNWNRAMHIDANEVYSSRERNLRRQLYDEIYDLLPGDLVDVVKSIRCMDSSKGVSFSFCV